MVGLDTLLAFSLAALLLSLSPGPSNLYIMARSINQGRSSGYAAASGLAIGSIIYVIATALGMAALFKYFPIAYVILKLGGAIYLVYLGIQYWRTPASTTTSPVTKYKSHAAVFRQSIIVELTNPKTALFFIAFLPQFVEPANGSVTMQLMILGSVYALLAFVSDLLVATLSGELGRYLNRHRQVGSKLDKTSGLILLGLGGYIGSNEVLEQIT
ncbi:LysE family translocator [Neptunicella marina]|uniref:LysE family translocator n=1 Tax=Neptunicella marina TaxID=2125989 RepID=A0A8J6IUX5_9ALTE|nr:LysE family translocator [Neptunicella marina]MBC3766305.1 LysE family translocator [Neptunicella marina]